jgi:hypothetical protein
MVYLPVFFVLRCCLAVRPLKRPNSVCFLLVSRELELTLGRWGTLGFRTVGNFTDEAQPMADALPNPLFFVSYGSATRCTVYFVQQKPDAR